LVGLLATVVVGTAAFAVFRAKNAPGVYINPSRRSNQFHTEDDQLVEANEYLNSDFRRAAVDMHNENNGLPSADDI